MIKNTLILFNIYILFFSGCALNNKNLKYNKIKNCKILKIEKEKFICYLEKANNGDLVSQSMVGYYYNTGKIVKQNLYLSTKWYLSAAKAGDTYSQRELGINYLWDYKDYKKAFFWLSKASLKNDAIAQRELADMYLKGLFIKKDYKKAFYFYKKAALQEDLTAQNKLAYLYLLGVGVKKNFSKAKYWYEKTAKKNNIYGLSQLGFLYARGIGVAQNYKKAYELLLKASNKNDKFSMGLIGLFYEMGFEVNKNLEEAKKWYIKSGNKYSVKRLKIVEQKLKK